MPNLRQSLYRQMHHVHPYSMYVFLQLITDGSPNKHLKKNKGKKKRKCQRIRSKKQYVNNFWIRIVRRKLGSQIDTILTTLYIKKIQFEVHKTVPPMRVAKFQAIIALTNV